MRLLLNIIFNINENRQYIGVEIDEYYYNIALNRVENYMSE